MIGNAREGLPQPIFRDPKAETLFEHFRGLLEDDHLQSVLHPADVRRGRVGFQGVLADDQDVVGREIRARFDPFEFQPEVIK